MKFLLRGCIAAAIVLLGLSPSNATDVFAGRRLYEENCVQCHGHDGRPIVPGTPYFVRGQGLLVPDAVLVRRIKSGKNLMPSYNRVLKDQEILDVIAYIRTLQR